VIDGNLQQRLQSARSNLDVLRGRRDAAATRLARVRDEVDRLEAEEEIADLAGGVLRTLIDAEVSLSVKAVEDLLTDGLQAVFEDQDLSVRADVEVQRGKVSVELVTVQRQTDGTVTEGLSRDAYGGAVTTVQSVLLRTIVIVRRGLRPVMFLDESLPAFDANYVGNMGAFLRSLCAKLGMDILLVSHNPAMVEAADHAYRIVKTDGKATFRRIR
jgi:DNA repair exonuclease SbcCD ATPase subunit